MANPKVADVLKQAQQYCNDATGEKFTPEATLAYLNAGIEVLFDKHPLAFCVDAIVTSRPTAVGLGGEISVLPKFGEALAHYVASKCLYEGADDEFNARLAKSHLDIFFALSA
jgi:hypothetical protein